MNDSTTTPTVRPGTDEDSIVQEISILLRDGRLDMGESVEDVARTLRINRRYIDAIEDGRFDDLPGSVYAIGFIRSFGDHVGLDGEELVRRFKDGSSSTKRPSELEFPEPIPESGVPGGAVLFAGLLVAAVAYGGWYMMTEDDNILSDLVAPVPEELAQTGQADQVSEAATNSLSLDLETPPVPAVEETEAATDGDALVEQAETELEAAMADVSEEIAEPPLAENTTATTESDSVETAVAETVEEVAEAAEVVEDTEEAPVETTEQVEETITEAGNESNTGEAPNQTVEAVDDEAVADEQADSTSEIEADESAADLNAAQLQALQTGMIDAPTPDAPAQDTTPTVEADVETPEVPETTESTEIDEADESVETAETEEQSVADAESEENADQTGSTDTVAGDEPETDAVETASVNPNQVIIEALEDSWVEIRDIGIDVVLMSRVLKAGERYEVPVGGDYELQTGNIGALAFSVGGEPLSSIGRDGEIGRNISLGATSLINRQGGSGR